MLTITNKELLKDYTSILDTDEEIKNFRLFYQEKTTNLIWYDGKIIYLSKEYFTMKNLINVDKNKRDKCALFLNDLKLIRELKELKIKFILEDNLAELLSRVERLGINLLSDEVAVEMIDDNDYTKLHEPIYLGNGVWMDSKN